MLKWGSRRLHVAVQLTEEPESTNDSNNNLDTASAVPLSYSSSPQFNFYQNLRLLDHRSLNIKIKPGKVVRQRFDHVNYAADYVLNAQVCLLLDELFFRRHNCNLIFFDGQSDGSNLIALFTMLIAEVNLRLEKIKATVSKINLIYLKSDYKTQESEDSDAIQQEAPISGHRVCNFFNTFDLLKWLLNVYRLARSVATIYESLEISFRIRTFSDKDLNAEEIFDIKLNVFDLYCSKMDEASMCKLLGYITATEQDKEDFQHTDITLLLRDYMEEEGNICKLLLCNIPQKMKDNKINAFLLTVAIEAYERFAKDENIHNCKGRRSSLSQCFVSETQPKPRAVCFSIPFNEHCSKKRLSRKSYSNEDLNTLRSWYSKLDEGFADGTTIMERYYDLTYAIRSDQLCRDIRSMSLSNDFVRTCLGTCCEDEPNDDLEENETDLEDLHNECKDALHQMSSEVDESRFSDILKVYFYAKHFAHSQQILNIQINQLERFKQRVNEALDDELNTLKSLMYVEDV